MELGAIAVCIPYGMLFIVSGIVVNIIQAACFLILWPVSKSTYRTIIGIVTEPLWLLLIWQVEWWAGLKVHLHGDLETYQLMGKENALVIPNHISEADRFIVSVLAQRCGCLRGALTVTKNANKYIPIYGWATWFSEFVFLNRSWAKDEMILKSTFQGLKGFPRNFWLTLFAEGTRWTPERLLVAQEFAISRGLHVPRNVLVPRFKGFVSAVKHMRSFVPAIYDVTMAVPQEHQTPYLLTIFKGQPCAVHLHIKRYSMKELPESDEGVAQWIRDRFVAKDAMLEKFHEMGQFEGKEIAGFHRSKKSLFAFICLASICFLGAAMLIRSFSLLSTWKGITLLVAGLAFDALIIHTIIEDAKLPEVRRNAPLEMAKFISSSNRQSCKL